MEAEASYLNLQGFMKRFLGQDHRLLMFGLVQFHLLLLAAQLENFFHHLNYGAVTAVVEE
jgi:hypothetical protein